MGREVDLLLEKEEKSFSLSEKQVKELDEWYEAHRSECKLADW